MKRIKVLTLMLAAVMLLTALTGSVAFADGDNWAEANGIYRTDETVEELYEQAKLEGEVNVYGCTGRIEDFIPDFEAAYPGVKVNLYDLGINEMLEKYTREHAAGIYTADILQLKEQTGSIQKEYIEQGLLYNYHPDDIFHNIIDPEFLAVTPFTIELDWWSYNTDLYSDLPISSWWDVTKPEWAGKFIFLDPNGEPDLPVLFACMIQNADMMAEEYEKVFGEPIVLADDEPNAGYAWIKRMAQNHPIIETKNGNIVKDVGGAPDMKEAPIGYGVSSKLRERDKQDFRLGVNPAKFDTPTTAVSFMVAQIADHAPHVAAAKLFVRFICGEADHNGPGIVPFMTAGSYSVFPDATNTAEMPAYDDIPKFKTDFDFWYDNYQDISDYWIAVQP